MQTGHLMPRWYVRGETNVHTLLDPSVTNHSHFGALERGAFVVCSKIHPALVCFERTATALTTQCQEALDKCRSNKSIMTETNRGQLAVLQEMSSWCLQDLGTKMNRTKIETLVTIQVCTTVGVSGCAVVFSFAHLTIRSNSSVVVSYVL